MNKDHTNELEFAQIEKRLRPRLMQMGREFFGSDTEAVEVVGNRVSPYIISVTDYTGVQALSHEDKGMDTYAIDGMLVRKNASSGSIKSLPGVSMSSMERNMQYGSDIPA